MNGPEAIAGIAAVSPQSAPALLSVGLATSAPTGLNFGEMIAQGIDGVEARIDHANRSVRAFALDDSVPLHEVTIALEEARLAVELASTIRARLVESFREIMNTQL